MILLRGEDIGLGRRVSVALGCLDIVYLFSSYAGVSVLGTKYLRPEPNSSPLNYPAYSKAFITWNPTKKYFL